MISSSLATALLLLIASQHGALAYTSFNTHCPLPNSTVNYVESPNVRGSLDIAWSCWATLLASAYSVVHLNVPARAEHMAATNPNDTKRMLNFWHTVQPVVWCIVCLFVPELVYGACVGEFLDAMRQLKGLRKFLIRNGADDAAEEWTLSHMFFANMGGFVLLHRPPTKKPATEKREGSNGSEETNNEGSNESNTPETYALTNNVRPASEIDGLGEFGRATLAEMNERLRALEEGTESTEGLNNRIRIHPAFNSPPLPGPAPIPNRSKSRDLGVEHIELSLTDPRPLKGLDEPSRNYHHYHLNAAVLRAGIENGILSARAVPREDITDRSKFDWYLKLITMLQLVQFFVGVTARLAYNLPITPAEVAVTAFAICSIVAWSLLFYKPKDARTTIVLETFEAEQVPIQIQEYMGRYLKGTGPVDSGPNLKASEYRTLSPPPDFLGGVHNRKVHETAAMVAMGCVIGMLFGGIHTAGWNLRFPSIADKWLWRSSSIATTVFPAVFGIGAACVPFLAFEDKKGSIRQAWENRPKRTCVRLTLLIIGAIGYFIGVAAYIAGRGILLVEMIRTLFYLPPEAYLVPSWTIDIPHIG